MHRRSAWLLPCACVCPPVGCNAGFYRDMDSNLCPRCPPNSVRRESTDPEAICECSSIDFRRSDPTDPATECLRKEILFVLINECELELVWG